MYPVHETEGGAPASINVHTKLMIVDDRLLIVGSANLARRSMGLDTECDLAVVAKDDADGGRSRGRATSCSPSIWAASRRCSPRRLRERGSLIAALDALNGGPRRLETLLVDQPPLPPELEAGVALTDVDEPITAAEPRAAPGAGAAPPAAAEARARRRDHAGPAAGARAAGARGAIGGGQLILQALQLRRGARACPGSASRRRAADLHAARASCFVPVNLLIAATAAAFGPLLGFAYALAGSLLAATLVFGIGRALGRDPCAALPAGGSTRVSRRLGRARPVGDDAVAPAADRAVHAWSIWSAGASEMRLRDFLLGSRSACCRGVALMTAVRRSAGRLAAPAGHRPISRSWPRLTLRRRCCWRWLLGWWAQAPAPAMSATLRIASYNIHACRGWDGRQDVARVAAVLREIDADVVGLQEVESRHGRSAIDQAEALGEALGMACIEGPLLHRPTAAGTATRC